MSAGLVTRFGQWIDEKFESKARESQLNDLKKSLNDGLHGLAVSITMIQTEYATCSSDLADIKTRIEKMEVYAGMKRVVDPTKAAVAKSAFSM